MNELEFQSTIQDNNERFESEDLPEHVHTLRAYLLSLLQTLQQHRDVGESSISTGFSEEQILLKLSPTGSALEHDLREPSPPLAPVNITTTTVVTRFGDVQRGGADCALGCVGSEQYSRGRLFLLVLLLSYDGQINGRHETLHLESREHHRL